MNMNIGFKFIIFVTLFISGCKVTYIDKFYINDFKWKQITIEELSRKYSVYVRPRMSDTSNNFIADLSYKIIDLNRYPFGDGLKKLKDEISSKKIPFDSIICSTFQYGLSLNQEYLFPNCYSVFHKGQIIKQYFHEPQNLVLEENFELDSNEALNDFNTLMIKPDGDNSSLYIITKINCDWSFEITKVIINANPFNDN